MKVIDLLNKIANGEEVPKRIKYQNEIYTYANDDYCTVNEKWLFSVSYTEKVAWLNDFLNDEVEIIEEEKEIEKEIEKLEKLSIRWKDSDVIIDGSIMSEDIEEVLANKINELIDEINELKSGKDE